MTPIPRLLDSDMGYMFPIADKALSSIGVYRTSGVGGLTVQGPTVVGMYNQQFSNFFLSLSICALLLKGKYQHILSMWLEV